ncbi:MAG: Rho termination factor N-terminal domain-containing protein [Chloroflexota bacterium]
MGVHPGQKRGAKGTNLGGEFVGPKSIAKFLAKMLTPSEAHAHDKSIAARKPSAPPSRALGRLLARPSAAEAKMHAADREHAARLSTRASTLEDRLSARQYGHGPMSNAGARETARQKLAATHTELGPIQARVDARHTSAAEDKAFYGDHMPSDSLAGARSAVARLQAKVAPSSAPEPRPPTNPRIADVVRANGLNHPVTHNAANSIGAAERSLRAGHDPADVAAQLRAEADDLARDRIGIQDAQDARDRTPAELRDVQAADVSMLRKLAAALESPPDPPSAPSTQTDTGGRITREEAGRRMLGDAEYERRNAAAPKKKTAAGRMTAGAPADLSRMPVADLRKLATERKIPGRSKLKKAELILALGG